MRSSSKQPASPGKEAMDEQLEEGYEDMIPMEGADSMNAEQSLEVR